MIDRLKKIMSHIELPSKSFDGMISSVEWEINQSRKHEGADKIPGLLRAAATLVLYASTLNDPNYKRQD